MKRILQQIFKGIFSAGDMRRGQSLVVWAIAKAGNVLRKYMRIYATDKSENSNLIINSYPTPAKYHSGYHPHLPVLQKFESSPE